MKVYTSSHYKVTISKRQILHMALPIAASMLVPQINFITNNIFLGGLGEKELGIAGIAGVYYLVFGVMGLGLNNGLQALIARRAGESRIEEISKLFHQGILIGLAIAAFGIGFTYFIAPFIFKSVLQEPSHAEAVIQFSKIRIWGLLFLYVYQMRNALLVGINQSRYLIVGTLAETLTNIALDYGFIYGHLTLPKLGFNGAAVASVIAEAVGLFVTWFMIQKKGISKELKLFQNFKYEPKAMHLLTVQSSPLILQHVISIGSWEFFYILIEHYGTTALAVSNTMRNVFGLFGCVTWSFAATTNAMVSNVIGQGKNDEVLKLIHAILQLSVTFAFVIFIVLNIFPETFLRIYQQDEQFTQAALPVIRVVSGALVFMSVSTIWLNAVTGTGNSKINLINETIAIIIYCLYNYFVLAKIKAPITFGWASEWLYWVCLFIPSYLYIKSGKWKAKKI